jgi:cytoskeleton protein RodZ
LTSPGAVRHAPLQSKRERRAISVPPSPMHEGRILRSARERRGLSLPEVRRATRISERLLDALEREAALDEFPAPLYATSFLRQYARFLQLDPDPLVQLFEDRNPPPEDPELGLTLLPRPSQPRGWPLLVVLSIVSVATAVILGVSGIGHGPTGGHQKAADQESQQPARPAAVTSPAEPRTPAQRHQSPAAHRAARPGLRLVGKVVAPCWMRIVADGSARQVGTLHPGAPLRVWARKSLQMRLGNAGGVVLKLNGRRVATGSSGQVVDLAFEWRRGEARPV